MKVFIKIILSSLLILAPFINYGQSNCNPYFLLKEGKNWTIANYNANDKYQGKQTHEILSVEESGNMLTAKIKFVSFDKKDKVVMEDEIEFICEDGVIKLDMAQYMPENMTESFKDMEVEMEFEDLQIPQSLSVGQYLEDGSMTMTVLGPMTMEFKVLMTDRKVMDQENITVPAGTYNAYKINSILKMDAMGIKHETKSVEYIAEKVGSVRTESYDKKGKLVSYTVLTDYSE